METRQLYRTDAESSPKRTHSTKQIGKHSKNWEDKEESLQPQLNPRTGQFLWQTRTSRALYSRMGFLIYSTLRPLKTFVTYKISSTEHAAPNRQLSQNIRIFSIGQEAFNNQTMLLEIFKEYGRECHRVYNQALSDFPKSMDFNVRLPAL
ncbi:hypothetical protein B7494_g6510 [Chlorociboria aeruginascens]|nr:hypothetical protein B7494_g6510 [Chlorociboria aeruginascens]